MVAVVIVVEDLAVVVVVVVIDAVVGIIAHVVCLLPPGMPLSFLMGIGDPSTVQGLEWLCDRKGKEGTPTLQPQRLAYVGLRDVDAFERKILNRLRNEHGIFASTIQDVDRLGIGRVMDLAFKALGVSGQVDEEREEAPLHLSFDIDGIDPLVFIAKEKN